MNLSSKHSLVGPLNGILSRLLILTALAALPVQVASGAPSETPIAASRFGITVDGVQISSFSELLGFTSEIEVIDRSGAPLKTMRVTLKRGMTRSIEMAAWHELVILGDIATAGKDATLTMHGVDDAPVARYTLISAWPSKIEIGATKDKSGVSVLTETVTFTCEFIQRQAL